MNTCPRCESDNVILWSMSPFRGGLDTWICGTCKKQWRAESVEQTALDVPAEDGFQLQLDGIAQPAKAQGVCES